MKKSLLALSALSICSLVLVGCNKKNDASSQADTKLQIKFLVDGDQCTSADKGKEALITAYYDNKKVDDYSLLAFSIDSGSDYVSLKDDKKTLQLNEVGQATIKATYTYSGKKTVFNTAEFTVEPLALSLTIKEVKEQAKDGPKSASDGAPLIVKTSGKVVSSYGGGGVIDDGTGAIEIYNFFTSNCSSATAIYKDSDDTSAKYGYLHVGDYIEVQCYAYKYYGVAQLEQSYNISGSYINLKKEKCFINKIDTPSSAKTQDETTIDDAAKLKALSTTTSNSDSGKVFNINGAVLTSSVTALAGGTVLNFAMPVSSTETSTDYTDTTKYEEFSMLVHKKTDATMLNAMNEKFTTLHKDQSVPEVGDKFNIKTTYISADTSKKNHKFAYYPLGTTIDYVPKDGEETPDELRGTYSLTDYTDPSVTPPSPVSRADVPTDDTTDDTTGDPTTDTTTDENIKVVISKYGVKFDDAFATDVVNDKANKSITLKIKIKNNTEAKEYRITQDATASLASGAKKTLIMEEVNDPAAGATKEKYKLTEE